MSADAPAPSEALPCACQRTALWISSGTAKRQSGRRSDLLTLVVGPALLRRRRVAVGVTIEHEDMRVMEEPVHGGAREEGIPILGCHRGAGRRPAQQPPCQFVDGGDVADTPYALRAPLGPAARWAAAGAGGARRLAHPAASPRPTADATDGIRPLQDRPALKTPRQSDDHRARGRRARFARGLAARRRVRAPVLSGRRDRAGAVRQLLRGARLVVLVEPRSKHAPTRGAAVDGADDHRPTCPAGPAPRNRNTRDILQKRGHLYANRGVEGASLHDR